jgi:hypothetical protein
VPHFRIFSYLRSACLRGYTVESRPSECAHGTFSHLMKRLGPQKIRARRSLNSLITHRVGLWMVVAPFLSLSRCRTNQSAQKNLPLLQLHKHKYCGQHSVTARDSLKCPLSAVDEPRSHDPSRLRAADSKLRHRPRARPLFNWHNTRSLPGHCGRHARRNATTILFDIIRGMLTSFAITAIPIHLHAPRQARLQMQRCIECASR